MKIKLQDYSLISNEWIESEIEIITTQRNKHQRGTERYNTLDGNIAAFERLKQRLIPSEKLVNVAYNEGMLDRVKSINNREIFLNSEIEIR